MDNSTFTRGSAKFKFTATELTEDAVNTVSKTIQSITAMKEYENMSIEELRFEDYNAYDGLFRVSMAKILREFKPSPHLLIKLYRSANIKSEANLLPLQFDKILSSASSNVKENVNSREVKLESIKQSKRSVEGISSQSKYTTPRMTYLEQFSTEINGLSEQKFTEFKYLFAKMVYDLLETPRT